MFTTEAQRNTGLGQIAGLKRPKLGAEQPTTFTFTSTSTSTTTANRIVSDCLFFVRVGVDVLVDVDVVVIGFYCVAALPREASVVNIYQLRFYLSTARGITLGNISRFSGPKNRNHSAIRASDSL
jgi:hypothetical protein